MASSFISTVGSDPYYLCYTSLTPGENFNPQALDIFCCALESGISMTEFAICSAQLFQIDRIGDNLKTTMTNMNWSKASSMRYLFIPTQYFTHYILLFVDLQSCTFCVIDSLPYNTEREKDYIIIAQTVNQFLMKTLSYTGTKHFELLRNAGKHEDPKQSGLLVLYQIHTRMLTGAFATGFSHLEIMNYKKAWIDQIHKHIEGVTTVLEPPHPSVAPVVTPAHPPIPTAPSLRGSGQLDPTYIYDDIQSLYTKFVLSNPNIIEKTLKPFQAECIHAILMKKDVFCVLRTNYGKTIPMIMATALHAQIMNDSPTCLIISPLTALMDELMERLKKMEYPTFILPTNIESEEFLKIFTSVTCASNNPKYLISSPETLAQPSSREILCSLNITHVMVDECHLSSSWGKDFRKEYSHIHEVRQYLDAPLGLFTATLTKTARNEVIKNTGVRVDSLIEIMDNPDRPEIFLQKWTGNKQGILNMLAEDLGRRGLNCDRSVVFVKSIRKTGKLNMQLRRKLTDYGRVRHGRTIKGYKSEHFCSATDVVTKRKILSDFKSEEGNIRVLFATVSYGLGIDNKRVRNVICLDGDNDPSSVWQKISRACRDGQKGRAIFQASRLFPKGACLRHALLSCFIGYKPGADRNACENSSQGCNCASCCSECLAKCVKNVPTIPMELGS